jgi:uncharacterized membrane protein YhaH (DUF805 family)
MKKLLCKRLNRGSYFLSLIGSLVFISIAGSALGSLVDMITQRSNVNGDVNPYVFVPIVIFWWVYAICTMIYRWHDIGYSGWFTLLNFIPIVGFISGLYILFKKGEIKTNNWGEEPKGVQILGLRSAFKPKDKQIKTEA